MTSTGKIITSTIDNSQIIDYNTPEFFCYSELCFYDSGRNYSIPDHWHEDLELIYVLEGELIVSVNGESRTLHSNEGIFVNSKRIHSNRSPQGTFCQFYCTVFHPSYLCVSPHIERKYVAPMIGTSSFDYITLTKNDWTAAIVCELEKMVRSGEKLSCNETECTQRKIGKFGSELEIIESAFRILRILLDNVEISEKPSMGLYNNNSGILKDMLVFIRDHYMDKIGLEDIATAGNVGKTLCTKLFRNYTSKTPVDYLIDYRIKKSEEMLTGTDISITEIAYATGFNSASHFTKTFREKIACTPHEFRNSGMISSF